MSSVRRTAVIILGALVLLLFIVPPHVWPHNYPADDAYFYLQVASNIHEGHGSTFNAITRTNGYHPLWMLMCVAGFKLGGGGRLAALHVVIAMQQMMAVAMVFMLYRITRIANIRHWFVALPMLLLYFSTRLYCSEAYINGAMLLLTLLLAASMLFGKERPRTTTLILTGCAGGFAALARLDNIFVIGMIFLGILLVSTSRTNGMPTMLRRFLTTGFSLGIPFLCVVTPYLLHNYMSFGHLAPISGAIKSTLPELTFSTGGLSKLGQLCFVAAVAAPLLCCFPFCDARKRFALLTLSGGFILHTLQIALTTSHHTGWPWYYMTGVINLSLLLCVAADLIQPRLPRILARIATPATILVTALILSAAVNTYALARYRNPAPTIEFESFMARLHEPPAGRWQEALGVWLKNNLPPETRIIIYDWPGIIAYTSELHILPPDGLINDYQYNDDLLAEGAAGYLKSRNITYWLGPAVPADAIEQDWYNIQFGEGSQRIEIFAPLYDKSAGSFTITDTDRLVNLREAVDHPDMPALELYRIQ
jgi:hypothetical protein